MSLFYKSHDIMARLYHLLSPAKHRLNTPS